MGARTRARLGLLLGLSLLALLSVSACGGDGEADGAAGSHDRLIVVTTVSPLRNIVENVGGDRVRVVGLVPEGTNSHTFEPAPSAVRDVERADLIVINGLNLELPALELAETSASDGVEILLLGESAITPDEHVFDFSFPEDQGNPNPHLWTDPSLAIRYAELTRDALIRVDGQGAAYYRANTERFAGRLDAMDEAFAEATGTIPAASRKMLTYHDSFPYFAPRYGLKLIGAIQPSDFSDPSPRELAGLVEQIRDAGVPAIFGSEVFRSEALETIAGEVGAVQINTLRDDDLPGEPGDPENTYVGMMVENVRTIVGALGGDASALDGFDIRDSWIPFAEFADG